MLRKVITNNIQIIHCVCIWMARHTTRTRLIFEKSVEEICHCLQSKYNKEFTYIEHFPTDTKWSCKWHIQTTAYNIPTVLSCSTVVIRHCDFCPYQIQNKTNRFDNNFKRKKNAKSNRCSTSISGRREWEKRGHFCYILDAAITIRSQLHGCCFFLFIFVRF